MSGAPRCGVIFDLDGTLIESAPAIQAIGSRMLAELELPALTLAEARSFIGHGAAAFARQALAARGVTAPEAIDQAVRRFEHFYAEADPAENRPMPGVDAALDALAGAGAALGLCTNKPEAPTRAVLAALGWEDRFDVVVTGDSTPAKKPDPAPLLEAASRLGVDPLVYVGDSEVDAETAARALLPFLLFTEGYRKASIDELPHAAPFSRFSELPALVGRLFALAD